MNTFAIPADAALRAGAEELIVGCLGVGPADRVLVLTDAHTRPLAEFIHTAARDRAPAEVEELPSLNDNYEVAYARIEAAVIEFQPTVVLFAAADDGDLLAWDPRYDALLNSSGARNAHLPALDPISLGEGLATDYREVSRFTQLVTDRATGTGTVRVINELGTDIVFDCDPARPWTPFDGIAHAPGEGGRLPQGETFCSPLTANGRIAASVLGYPFNASTGLLTEPVVFEIRDGRLVSLTHPDTELTELLQEWFARDPHANRIGELALGTNRACTRIIGNLLFDENVPGCHIALGHPFGDMTGACWESGVHVDLVVAQPTITLDGATLLERGVYLEHELTTQNGVAS